MRKTVLMAAMAAVCTGITGAGAWGQTINIDASKEGPKINPRMYGIFLEEISHGVDGGLYAEMLNNRAFESAKPPEGFTYIPGPPPATGAGRGAGGRGGRGASRTIDARG